MLEDLAPVILLASWEQEIDKYVNKILERILDELVEEVSNEPDIDSTTATVLFDALQLREEIGSEVDNLPADL